MFIVYLPESQANRCRTLSLCRRRGESVFRQRALVLHQLTVLVEQHLAWRRHLQDTWKNILSERVSNFWWVFIKNCRHQKRFLESVSQENFTQKTARTRQWHGSSPPNFIITPINSYFSQREPPAYLQSFSSTLKQSLCLLHR